MAPAGLLPGFLAMFLEAVFLQAVLFEAVLLEAVLLEAVLFEAVLLEAVFFETVFFETVLFGSLVVPTPFIVTHDQAPLVAVPAANLTERGTADNPPGQARSGASTLRRASSTLLPFASRILRAASIWRPDSLGAASAAAVSAAT